MAEASSLAALASRFIETESVPWIETGPGNKMKVIYHDRSTGMLTILARLEPGAGIPAHVHEDLEQTFVIEGSLLDDEGECTAGNFVIRAKGAATRRRRPRAAPCLSFSLSRRRGCRRCCSSTSPPDLAAVARMSAAAHRSCFGGQSSPARLA